MNLSVSNRLIEKLNKLRDLRSHSNPNMNYEELLEELAELGLDTFDPARKAERARLRKQKVAAKFGSKSNSLPPAELKSESKRKSEWRTEAESASESESVAKSESESIAESELESESGLPSEADPRTARTR